MIDIFGILYEHEASPIMYFSCTHGVGLWGDFKCWSNPKRGINNFMIVVFLRFALIYFTLRCSTLLHGSLRCCVTLHCVALVCVALCCVALLWFVSLDFVVF